jgi:hypothetical protein
MLLAIVFWLPNPSARIRPGATPASASTSTTDSARARDNARFPISSPMLSVCPATVTVAFGYAFRIAATLRSAQ